jgi:hypothetical protein
MARQSWKWTSLLALVGMASTASAQQATPPPTAGEVSAAGLIRPRPGTPCPPALCPPVPSKTPSPSDPAVVQPTSTSAALPAAESDSATNFQIGSMAAAGTGVSAAAQGAAAGATTSLIGFPQIPLVMPGLLTAANSESARPMDRISFTYSYLDRFQIFQSQLNNPNLPLGTSNRSAGFNLNTFSIGVEKTFLDGKASFYAQIPFLDATGNTTGQAIDGLGDVSLGLKYVLLADDQYKNLLTGGFTVSAPTGRDVQYPTSFKNVAFNGNLITTIPGPGGTVATFTRINPTFLQPWVAGQIGSDRLLIHNYFGVLIPTDNNVATFLNNDLTVGYTLYRCNSDRWITSVTPVVGFQALIPVSHRGEPASITPATGNIDANGFPTAAPTFGFSDQFFVSGGAQIGLGQRAMVSFGVVTPVVGPRAFSTGFNLGLNYSY